jgi:hypothetical protein
MLRAKADNEAMTLMAYLAKGDARDHVPPDVREGKLHARDDRVPEVSSEYRRGKNHGS